MFDSKWIADLITAARATLGVVMIWLGITQGEQALPTVIPMTILCWSGDFFDGMLARKSRNPRKTYIGDHDVQIDMFVSVCLALYALRWVGWRHAGDLVFHPLGSHLLALGWIATC